MNATNVLTPKPLIVLFSGMAADANVFVGQKICFQQLMVPSWPVPLVDESMNAYAKRLAGDFSGADVQILGGASFGGIIAMHVAQYLNPQAVLLIGSARSPDALPAYVRWLRPLRPAVRFLPIRLMQVLAMPLTVSVFKEWVPSFSGLVRQFVRCDPRVLKWSLEQILVWSAPVQISAPIFHIHGERDWILPLKNMTVDHTVQNGGHLITLTHASQVNEYMREVMQNCDQPGLSPEAIQ